MAPLRLGALAAALFASAVSSQTPTSSSDPTVWAAVAFVNHGEKTPVMGDLRQVLTPEGAQQMWRQGQAFRSRYLIETVGAADTTVVGSAYIQNIETNSLDNGQLSVVSQTDEWVAGGAMAFMQGLYPAANQTFNSDAGGVDIARNWAEDSNITNYPLDGYQYPQIQTLSALDRESIIIQGTENCDAWVDQMNTNLTKREDLAELANSTFSFYQRLFGTGPLNGTIDMSYANFWYASEIYEFVNYMYSHNETVHDDLLLPTTTLPRLKSYATTLERAMNSKITSDDEDSLNILYTIAGRTLAQQVAEQFIDNIGEAGVTTRLTLMFGSFRPLLSFFSLGGLVTRANSETSEFSTIPEPGAAMVFELIGDDPDHPDSLPTFDKLSIRFYYRATADEDEPFSRFSLFSSGFDGASIPYSAFVDEMQSLGKNPGEWCNICKPDLSWCNSYYPTVAEHHSTSLNPALAGLIGAIVTTAVLGLVCLALFFLFGFRLQRGPPKERNSSLGGFKGAEKMASDTDLAITKGGVHERVGSWELRGGEEVPPVTTTAGIVTSDFGSRKADDDGISVLNERPVKPHESV